MSFESPSGAPAPEGAASLTPPPAFAPPEQQGQPYQGAQPYQQPAPPYQDGAPYQGAQPYPAPPPYQGAPQPFPGYQGAAPPAPHRMNSAAPIAMMVAAGLYVVLCLIEIFALNHRVSLANQLIADPNSVTIDQANSADNTVSALSLAAIVVFLVLIVVLLVWQRSLRNALGPTGHYQQVLKESRYRLFRTVWLISILLAVVLRGSGNLDTPQDVISHDHQYMAYYGIRAALGVFMIFLALQLRRASENAFRSFYQVGYGAGGPAYPMS